MRIILKENDSQVASLQVTNPPKVGDSIEGWRVVSIDIEEVISKGLSGEDLASELLIVNVERL